MNILYVLVPAYACLKSRDFTWPCTVLLYIAVAPRSHAPMYRCTAMMPASICDHRSGLRHWICLLCRRYYGTSYR